MERVRINGASRGRPRGQTQIASNGERRTLAELARAYTVEALQVLVDVIRDERALTPYRMQAASMILDRGYGKPAQSHELTGANQGPMTIKLDQTMLAKLPDDTLVALQALLANLSRGGGDLTAAFQVDSSDYEDTLH